MILQTENCAENELIGFDFIRLEVPAQEMGEFQSETHAAAGGILDPGQQATGFFQLFGGQLFFIVQVLESVAQPTAELVPGQQQFLPEGRHFLGREFRQQGVDIPGRAAGDVSQVFAQGVFTFQGEVFANGQVPVQAQA